MLDEYMQTIGYTKEQIDMIEASYPIHSYTESTLLYCIKNLVNYLRRNTFDNQDIVYITTTIPQIITMSIENIKDKVNEFSKYGISKINIYNMFKKYPYIIEMSNQRIHNKYQIFDELGFSISDINHIFIQNPCVLNIDPGVIKNKYLFFKDFGYKQDEIHTILSTVPGLISMSTAKIQNKIDELTFFGFKKDELIKVTYYLPNIYIFDRDEFRSKTLFMDEYGYTLDNIISIIKRIPMLLNSNYADSLNEKWKILENCGFSSDDIVDLTLKNPYILLYSNSVLQDNYQNLLKNGFYHKEVLQMIKDTPLLFGYSCDNIKAKLQYYTKLDLLPYIKNHSHVLLISLDYIKKRKKYITNEHFEDLFLNDIKFQKRYHVSRLDVMRGK